MGTCLPSLPCLATLAAAVVLLGSACDGGGSTGGSSTGAGATTSAGGAGASASVSAGGAQSGGAQTGGSAPMCPTCGAVEAVATLPAGPIAEASGIAVSRTQAGVVYLHNDSGDTARFFATDHTGADRGVYAVTGVTAEDWEDMALGPCASGDTSCLYFGDIGDNFLARTSYQIVRVAEPTAPAAGTHDVTGEVFTFHYPGGPRNAEAMFVHPDTGQVFLITKDAGGSELFTLPMPLVRGPELTAELLGPVTVNDVLKLVTGAAVSPTANAILMRTYTSVWYFPVLPGQSFAQALAGEPCALPTPMEMQGEAITFDGRGYLSIGEGASPTLHALACGL